MAIEMFGFKNIKNVFMKLRKTKKELVEKEYLALH